MLWKLSIQSLRKSIKDFAIYFFTLIMGVTIFYVFNAIKSQSAIMELSESKKEMVELMNRTMAGVSVFVAIILGFLIIYASRFLMKRRKKEFGLYLLLGMGKRKVSLILFLETVLIGVISLVAGLVIGILFSQLTSVFVAHMFEADMSKYRFVFSGEACLRTVGCFIIIYVIVIIFNTISINKCKLIDLFNSGKKSEKVKVKNPWVCIGLFIAAVALLGFSYYKVAFEFGTINTNAEFFCYIIFGIIGTLLVFWSVSGMLLRIVTAIKKLYFKGLNTFTFRQISSRINTMVVSMSIICLMLFVTICVLANGLTIRNSMLSNLNELAPADVSINKRMNVSVQEVADPGYNEHQAETSNLSIPEIYKLNGYDITKDFKEYISVNTYRTDELTMEKSFGDYLETLKQSYPYLNLSSREDIMKLSDYNKVAEFYGKKTYDLDKDEYMIIADFEYMAEERKEALKLGTKITISNHELSPKYSECKEGFLEMAGNRCNQGIIIVPDEIIDESSLYSQNLIAKYNTSSDKEVKEIEKKLQDFSGLEEQYIIPTVNTRTDIAEACSGLGAIVAFVCLYLGIIFLISGAAVLALKELSESADNLERYRILKQLGAEDKLINKALFKQIGIFFACPLILSVIHSVFGMIFSKNVIGVFGTEKMFISIVMTAVILIFVYGGYFLITYFCSKNMIQYSDNR